MYLEISNPMDYHVALYIFNYKKYRKVYTDYQQMINHLSTNVVEGIADINDKLDDMARRLDM